MLLQKINTDLKQAMKDKDTQTVSVLRMLISAWHNETIALKKKEQGLSEEEEIKVLKREVKKHKDSIEQYEKGGRPELAEKEKKELEILQKYLPEEMSEDEVRKLVGEVLAEMGEVSAAQFGLVMKNVMAKTAGKADGGMVSKVVKEEMNRSGLTHLNLKQPNSQPPLLFKEGVGGG